MTPKQIIIAVLLVTSFIAVSKSFAHSSWYLADPTGTFCQTTYNGKVLSPTQMVADIRKAGKHPRIFFLRSWYGVDFQGTVELIEWPISGSYEVPGGIDNFAVFYARKDDCQNLITNELSSEADEYQQNQEMIQGDGN